LASQLGEAAVPKVAVRGLSCSVKHAHFGYTRAHAEKFQPLRFVRREKLVVPGALTVFASPRSRPGKPAAKSLPGHFL